MVEKTWFEADRNGLAKIVAGRPKFFVVAELWSNAIDEDGVTRIDISLESIGHGIAQLRVVDNAPSGFRDLSHAYTLYGESYKKGDPEKIGRFDLGEKLVLALCNEAEVVSTTGSVSFRPDGTRVKSRKRTEAGTVFSAVIRMTKAEIEEISEQVDRLCVRDGITTTYNGRVLQPRVPVATFRAALPTRIGEELRDTVRQTEVRLYEPISGFPPTIYELGVPIVEADNAYDVDVRQKVPLGQDRDSVTPRFLRELRVAVLNHTYMKMSAETAAAPWVAEALESGNTKPEAIAAVVRERFGDKVLSFNPSDTEANRRAVSEGYTVIHGTTFSKPAWDNIRAHAVVAPSTSLFKTVTAFTGGPEADPVDLLAPEEFSEGMRALVGFTHRFAEAVLQYPIDVYVCRSPEKFRACFATGGAEGITNKPMMYFNLTQLGRAWFDVTRENLVSKLPLIVHELAHNTASDHLSEDYHRAICDIAAKGMMVALEFPDIFELSAAAIG